MLSLEEILSSKVRAKFLLRNFQPEAVAPLARNNLIFSSKKIRMCKQITNIEG